jgi:Methyltransferase FkbM domain
MTANYFRREQQRWNTMVPGHMAPDRIGAVETTQMIRLETYLEAQNLTPALVKIDVEGFELPVLRGLEGHIRAGHRRSIICELTPTAYPLSGTTIRDVLFIPAQGTSVGNRWVRRRLRRVESSSIAE